MDHIQPWWSWQLRPEELKLRKLAEERLNVIFCLLVLLRLGGFFFSFLSFFLSFGFFGWPCIHHLYGPIVLFLRAARWDCLGSGFVYLTPYRDLLCQSRRSVPVADANVFVFD